MRYVITPTASGVKVNAAGTEIELEGVSRELLTFIWSSPSFTLQDVVRVAPDASPAELADLLESLTRVGLLQAALPSGT